MKKIEVIRLYDRNITRSQSFLYNVLDLSFTCVTKMHRMDILAWFTCLICTAKMALSTGLEHSNNTNTLEQDHSIRENFEPLISFQTQKSFEKIYYNTFFYKQLGSGLSPQSCLYFQDFWGSKRLNGCLVV